jgi:N-acetyl-gamma-glutamyl-phosphate reductase
VQEYALRVHKIPVGILGASGYAGRELCALVANHPAFSLEFATANERRGERANVGGRDIRFVATDDAPLRSAELVFSALPHGASGAWTHRVHGEGIRAIDLSSDLRPGHAATSIPYGLTELTRESIRGATLVSNPGCYPTASLIALAPLLAAGLVVDGSCVTIDAASGVTGAGNSPKSEYLFGEVTENFRAYAIGNTHRHLPEMQAMVGTYGADVDLLFTPHLLPVARGILATITVRVTTIPDDLLGVWRNYYAGEPFVEVADESPALRDVVRRNVVRLTARRAESVRQPTVVVFAAIDNLVKGAAGQAVQNANVALGLAETLGLPR